MSQIVRWGVIVAISRETVFRILLLITLTIALYWPAIRWLGKAWIENDYYNHGFFLLAVSLLLIWFARNQIKQASVVNQQIGLPVLLVAGALYIAGFVLHRPVILSFSLLPTASQISFGR